MANKIKVAVRVRPLVAFEVHQHSECIVQMVDGTKTVLRNPNGGEEITYNFDHAYWSYNSADSHFVDNQNIWDDLGETMIDNLLEGINSSVITYGQTCTGKSYTILGSSGNSGTEDGLAIIACKRIFQKIAQFKDLNNYSVEMSVMQIYMGEIEDLVNAKNKGPFKVNPQPKTCFGVEGLTKQSVTSEAEALKVVTDSLHNIHLATNCMNSNASRAHIIIAFTVKHTDEEKKVKTASICFADLAGFENVSKAGHSSRETNSINLSLGSFRNVLKSLADHDSFVPYRESKLTQTLKECIGGNCNTVLIATISPSNLHHNETRAILLDASKAYSINNTKQ